MMEKIMISLDAQSVFVYLLTCCYGDERLEVENSDSDLDCTIVFKNLALNRLSCV